MSVTRKPYNPKSPFAILHHKVQAPEHTLDILLREIPSAFPDVCKYSPDTLLKMGCVYIDGKRVSENFALKNGQSLKAHLQPKRFPKISLLTLSSVVFQDETIVVINKPHGVPVHATRDNYFENALEKTKHILNTRLYVTHRLDTDTQGLCVFAKTAATQRDLNFLFSSSQVKKLYEAKTLTPLQLGELIHYADPEPSIPRRFSTTQESESWKVCRLEVLSSLATSDHFTSKIHLITGRTHQIRGQLALTGNPILGDYMYGSNQDQELGLKCIGLEFILNSKPYSFSL